MPGLRWSEENAPCWLERDCATMRPPVSSEITHTLAPICGVPEESRTMPESVPKPGLAEAGTATASAANMTQPKVRYIFMRLVPFQWLSLKPLSASRQVE